MVTEEVRTMMRTIHHSLERVDKLGTRSPRKRHARLGGFIAKEALLPEERSLLGYAFRSFGFVAFSAFAKAKAEGLAQPAHATRRSVGILDLAKVPNSDEAWLMQTDGVVDLRTRMRVLDGAYLVVTDESEPCVDLSDQYRSKVELMALPGNGCPIYGNTMERMYERYVDAVFAPTLAREDS